MTKPVVDVDKFFKKEFKKGDIARINLFLPRDTHTKLKVLSAQEEKPLNSIVNEIIDLFLKKKGLLK